MDSPNAPFLEDMKDDVAWVEDSDASPHLEHGRPAVLSVPAQLKKRSRHSQKLNFITFPLAIWGLIAIFLHLPSNASYDVYRPATLPLGFASCYCGTTEAEALSLNCAYDALATAWLPPHCRDEALTDHFNRAGPGPDGAWSYFGDENGTIPLSLSTVASLGPINGTFWAHRTWHLVHCVYYWMKYWRMRETGAVMEERFDNMAHLQHCSKLLLKPPPERDFLIEVPVLMVSSIEAAREREGGHG
ncbi:hypothetical protein B0T14DRAFT_522637 [Immersiella caudata]|uniref:Uncharacterized protein n=1 Tax=Immersiella caudata TaxID=314043 RepID=A0AA39WIR0_9PEZI|nr:hypothetical protein B0T14DRAFT_522637 [Immersiella caudata]